MKNIFRLKENNKVIKEQQLEIPKILLRTKKKKIKTVKVNNYQSNSYIEYESKGDKNKTLSVEKHLNKIRPYLKDIINNLKKSDTWKIQLTKVNDNIEILINDEADQVIKNFLNHSKIDIKII